MSEQLDLFDDAFDKLVIGDNTPFESKPAQGEAHGKPAEEKVVDTSDEGKPAEAQVVGDEKPVEAEVVDTSDEGKPAEAQVVGDEKPVVEAENAKSKPAKPDEDAEDVLARLANLVKRSEPAEAKAKEKDTPQEVNPYTPDEQEFLKTYEQDWGDVSRAEELKRRVEYQGLTQYVFSQVAQALAPLEQAVQQLMTQARLGGVKAAVSDYDDLMPKVESWVEKQPAYLQSAYKHVIQNGSAEDVADLVARYKKEAGGPAPTSVRKPVAELPTPAKQAVEALAPVSSERSATAAHEPDENDFDSAFERAIEAIK